MVSGIERPSIRFSVPPVILFFRPLLPGSLEAHSLILVGASWLESPKLADGSHSFPPRLSVPPLTRPPSYLESFTPDFFPAHSTTPSPPGPPNPLHFLPLSFPFGSSPCSVCNPFFPSPTFDKKLSRPFSIEFFSLRLPLRPFSFEGFFSSFSLTPLAVNNHSAHSF